MGTALPGGLRRWASDLATALAGAGLLGLMFWFTILCAEQLALPQETRRNQEVVYATGGDRTWRGLEYANRASAGAQGWLS
jgi:hypothetical protein